MWVRCSHVLQGRFGIVAYLWERENGGESRNGTAEKTGTSAEDNDNDGIGWLHHQSSRFWPLSCKSNPPPGMLFRRVVGACRWRYPVFVLQPRFYLPYLLWLYVRFANLSFRYYQFCDVGLVQLPHVERPWSLFLVFIFCSLTNKVKFLIAVVWNLLKIEPCGGLDVETKCRLISEHLPKVRINGSLLQFPLFSCHLPKWVCLYFCFFGRFQFDFLRKYLFR